MQQRGDGRRVGRRDDGADEQSAGPGSGEEQRRHCSNDRGRYDYADGSQGESRPQGPSEVTRIGAEPAIEQNDGETNAADQIGGVEVMKPDVARSLFPGAALAIAEQVDV
jgi:hypothetical protein